MWKDASRAPEAAQALGLTADRLRDLGLVDRILSEPLGGAHRDPHLMGASMKKVLTDQMRHFITMPIDELVQRRLERLLQYGKFEIKAQQQLEEIASPSNESLDGDAVVNLVEEDNKIEETTTQVAAKPTTKKRTVRKTDAAKKTAVKKA